MKLNRNFVNLNVNPCKMCMPMGAALAFKGIEKSILLLHGSQGCSTYIRRQITRHFSEPIDIASSALNEKETVYGGANNLKKGLNNVIKLYNPKVIGIATTCLAETIGEDINRIIEEYKISENISNVQFVTVSTPGYGGSQYEGYYLSLKRILEELTKKTKQHKRINIITGLLSPADIRHIKEVMECFGVEYTLFPDISDTLDAPYTEEYKRIPDGGTTFEEIKKMSGAAATIEMGVLFDDSISPGVYLQKQYGVPLYKCPLPIGLENTDEFIKLLSFISGKDIPDKIKKARGRMLDGMIDSHKINALGRAAIFAEPDQAYVLYKICIENGIYPAVIATGCSAPKLKNMMNFELNKLKEVPIILEDTDFDTIYGCVKKANVNLLIGNSDGKFIREKENIPLVHIGFPIHDRIGGQRKLSACYTGSINLLDNISNTIIESQLQNFRQERLEEFFINNDSKKERNFS